MLISSNTHIPKFQSAQITFSKEEELPKVTKDNEWDWHAVVQDKNIPEQLKKLKLKIGEELQKNFSLLGFRSPMAPDIIFSIPDKIPYRNFLPLASVKTRMNQANQRIVNAFRRDTEKNTKHTTIYKLIDNMYLFLGFQMPKALEEKLENTLEPVERDEILRHFMFDSTKTACANLDISHKVLNIDLARLNALMTEINNDTEIKEIYPDFEKTFVDMMTADIILKYQTMTFMKDSLINPQLLWKSFKSGYRFILGIPGLIDTPLALVETIKHYATGIYNFKKIIKQVNDKDFSKVKVEEAIKVFPLFALKMLESMKPNIAKVQFERNNIQVDKYLNIISILKKIENLPDYMKKRIENLTKDTIKPLA